MRFVRFLFLANRSEETSFFSDPFRLFEFVRKWHVSTRSKALDIRAMLIFHSENGPDTSSANFGESDAEGKHGRVLELIRYDHVEYPVEAKDRINDHSCIVPPCILESHVFTEKLLWGIKVKQT